MKRLVFVFLILLPIIGWTQAPNAFKYQSVARNATGNPLENAQLGLRISIRNLSVTGSIVFQETHFVWTNEFGLFTLSVGGGTPVISDIQSVDWSNGAKFIQIEADLTGGTNYQPFGVTELLSVPYALFANSSNSSVLPAGTAIGNTSFWDGSNWVVDNNNIYNAGMFVGIGTSSPLQRLDVNGNINIPLDSAYMIGNRRILRTEGNNIYIGENTGINNLASSSNTFLGDDAGEQNVVGSQNTFLGTETGYVNTTGNQSTFVGNRAGFANTIGNENTFIGAYAGQFNTEGEHNSFLGVTTGTLNTTGSENTFLGAHAGYFNTTGSFNTYVGNFTAQNAGAGNYNTLLGFEAEMSTGNLQNSMALGYGALVSANNTVVVGNSSVVSIGGQVGWSTLSDGRLKTDIQENELGLNFINSLKTVNYEYKTEGQKGIRYSGLIAQDVENVLQKLGTNFSGIVRPQNDESYYSIRYSEFVIPLIKAVQEQSEEIDSLNNRIEQLEEKVEMLLQGQKK